MFSLILSDLNRSHQRGSDFFTIPYKASIVLPSNKVASNSDLLTHQSQFDLHFTLGATE